MFGALAVKAAGPTASVVSNRPVTGTRYRNDPSQIGDAGVQKTMPESMSGCVVGTERRAGSFT